MTPTRYQAVFVDLDGTIFDTETSLQTAVAEVFATHGIEASDDHLAEFFQINDDLWLSVERGERTPEQVNVARFAYFVSSTGVDADPQALADAFPSALARYGELYPGAADVLKQLSDAVPLVLVTNGIGEIQRARIDRLGLDAYFTDYVISGEEHVAKPSPEIFEVALSKIDGLKANQTVMIGDSLEADIGGAHGAGMESVWITNEVPQRLPNPAPTYTITSLDQVIPIVMGTSV